ncbi:MAG: FtsX-like permease family protein [Trueperaceae bacterium]|nr:FtsX-like permease family protein [Trueperaceae bacterium]
MRRVILLAWRNLWRQRRRSLVTAGAVAVVVALSLVYFGFGGASKNSLYQNLTQQGGHAQVRAPGWRDARALDDALIRDATTVRAQIDEIAHDMLDAPLVVGVLEVPTLLSGEVRSRGMAVRGQDWPERMVERRLDGATLNGRFLEGDAEIVLGASLARALDVEIGDDVFAYAPGGEGFGAAAYRLVGTVNLADPNQEIATAWTTLAEAQALAAPGAVHRFEVHGTELVHLSDDTVARELAAALDEALPQLEALDWQAVDPALSSLLDTLDPMLFAVSIMFFVLAGLLVLNTVYLSVMERIREFGVIHALGAGDGRVLGMIATESVFLCLLGTAAGLAVGLGTVAAYADGLTIPAMSEYFASFGFEPVFYLSLTPGQVAFAVGFAVFTALAAALWPAWIASRLEPVEAMRFQA